MNEDYLIDFLSQYNGFEKDYKMLPKEEIIRALMNITMPNDLSEEFYEKQDEYLQDLLSRFALEDARKLEYDHQICLWKGDITKIKADAIVNACNEQMLGCFIPMHKCIDNAIHSFAGLQARRDMMRIMAEQGHPEPNGQVKVTKGYNLPAKYIFHTVGPVTNGAPTKENVDDLSHCYLSCLKQADEMGLKNIVFCSIATGVYAFPIESASLLALQTTMLYLKTTKSRLRVVFDLYSDKDFETYQKTWKQLLSSK